MTYGQWSAMCTHVCRGEEHLVCILGLSSLYPFSVDDGVNLLVRCTDVEVTSLSRLMRSDISLRRSLSNSYYSHLDDRHPLIV